MKLLSLVFCLFIFPVQAEIYRWVDENGNVVYSDAPHPQAEEIKLPPGTTYTPQPVPSLQQETEASDESSAAAVNYKLRIISPSHDEGFWANDGNVTVTVVIEPELDQERGDKIVFKLDGAQVGEPQVQTSVQLINLDRGTHTLSAAVIDARGAVLGSSEQIVFHLHRTSILNKPRKN